MKRFLTGRTAGIGGQHEELSATGVIGSIDLTPLRQGMPGKLEEGLDPRRNRGKMRGHALHIGQQRGAIDRPAVKLEIQTDIGMKLILSGSFGVGMDTLQLF
ncbi:MAG: hypothetical protein ACLPIX_23085 [Rhodomicrobium sp.]